MTLRNMPLGRLALALLVAAPVTAQAANPWTLPEGSGELTLGLGSQTADRFYAGDTELDLPTDLDLDTTALSWSYGLTDRLTLDLQTSYGSSDFLVDPGLAPQGGLSGLNDTRIGLRWAAWRDGPAIVTLRAAAILEGDYDTGAITAIGDGGSGFELEGLAGYAFDNGFAVAGGVGYRTRGNDIPDEWFADLSASYAFTESVSGYAGLQSVRSDGDLQIGGPGFNPARFPEVQEEYDLGQAGLAFQFADAWSLSVGGGAKFEGRNTAKSRFWSVQLGYRY
jgi:hypothetical protein